MPVSLHEEVEHLNHPVDLSGHPLQLRGCSLESWGSNNWQLGEETKCIDGQILEHLLPEIKFKSGFNHLGVDLKLLLVQGEILVEL